MARPRSTDIALRDREICRRAGEGESRRALSEEFGISQARLSQIILADQDEISDDANRALMFAQLDFVKMKILEIFSRPRQPKVTPSGRIVYYPLLDENGEPIVDHKGNPLPDPTKPIFDDSPMTEAAKMIPNLIDRQSKLYALDRPKPKEHDESQQFRELMNWAESVVSENKALKARMDAMGIDPVQVFEAEVIATEEDQENPPPAIDA